MKQRIESKDRITGMMTDCTKCWYKLTGSLLLLLVCGFQAEGQRQDCIFLHFDKSFYVSGETIWFKAYALNDSGQTRSRVLHVDLINHQNQTIAQQKLLIDNGTSSGSITLPLDAEEGNYQFRAYTHYNLNFKPPFVFEAIIPVYQPDQENYSTSEQIEKVKRQQSEADKISIISDKEIYKPRDSLTVSFQLNDPNAELGEGSFSVAVVPFDIVNLQFQPFVQSECADRSFKGGLWIHPERSLFIEGSFHDPNSTDNVTSRLISIYMEKTSQLIKASFRNGKVKTPVSDYWGAGTFQIVNHDPNSPNELVFTPESGREMLAEYYNTTYYNSNPPTRTPEVLDYISKLKKRKKIVELFDLYKPKHLENSRSSSKIPDAVYYAKDYRQIYSFEEFINEAVRNVKVRTEDSVKTVRLFNREKGSLFRDHPWYIVDGFLTFDESKVLNIQYQDIIEVRLYTTTSTLVEYFQGFMWRNGVMEIITRDVKYARELRNSPSVFELQGFSLQQDFNNTLALSESKEIPDVRGLMYWSPNVSINEQGYGRITLPLSDDTGKFAIVVKGTTNFKQPVTGYCTFEVKLD